MTNGQRCPEPLQITDALSAKLHQPDGDSDGGDYYDCWVAALSQLVTEHSITSDPELTALTRSWQRAADATPHGRPICLENDPLRSEGINSGDVIDASPTKETNR